MRSRGAMGEQVVNESINSDVRGVVGNNPGARSASRTRLRVWEVIAVLPLYRTRDTDPMGATVLCQAETPKKTFRLWYMSTAGLIRRKSATDHLLLSCQDALGVRVSGQAHESERLICT